MLTFLIVIEDLNVTHFRATVYSPFVYSGHSCSPCTETRLASCFFSSNSSRNRIAALAISLDFDTNKMCPNFLYSYSKLLNSTQLLIALASELLGYFLFSFYT